MRTTPLLQHFHDGPRDLVTGSAGRIASRPVHRDHPGLLRLQRRLQLHGSPRAPHALGVLARAHPGPPLLRRLVASCLRAPGLARLAAPSLWHGVPRVHRHRRSFRLNAGASPNRPRPRTAALVRGTNSDPMQVPDHLGCLVAACRPSARTVFACCALAPPRCTRRASPRSFVSPHRWRINTRRAPEGNTLQSQSSARSPWRPNLWQRLTRRCSGPGRYLVLPDCVQLATRRLHVARGGRAAERQR